MTLTATVAGTAITCPMPVAGTPAQTTLTVVYKPYLKIFGGNAVAGSAFANTGACTDIKADGIIGWNQDNAPTYDGAGTQFGAQALSIIQDFAGAQNSRAGPPLGLSFANTGASVIANPPSGQFGGNFGYAPCPQLAFGTPDFNQTSGSDASPTLLSSILSTSNLTGSKTVTVTGDVLVNQDVKYKLGGWSGADLSTIPSFKLVVKGNIYVDPGVHELDGVYVAEPSSPASKADGIIFTCADQGSNSGAVTNAVLPASYYATCNSQLTIYGSFVAAQVKFMRTYGNLYPAGATPNQPAEIFNYSPELWLATPNTTSSPGAVDSITSLPPVL